jgi:hypothetical protein
VYREFSTSLILGLNTCIRNGNALLSRLVTHQLVKSLFLLSRVFGKMAVCWGSKGYNKGMTEDYVRVWTLFKPLWTSAFKGISSLLESVRLIAYTITLIVLNSLREIFSMIGVRLRGDLFGIISSHMHRAVICSHKRSLMLLWTDLNNYPNVIFDTISYNTCHNTEDSEVA